MNLFGQVDRDLKSLFLSFFKMKGILNPESFQLNENQPFVIKRLTRLSFLTGNYEQAKRYAERRQHLKSGLKNSKDFEQKIDRTKLDITILNLDPNPMIGELVLDKSSFMSCSKAVDVLLLASFSVDHQSRHLES